MDFAKVIVIYANENAKMRQKGEQLVLKAFHSKKDDIIAALVIVALCIGMASFRPVAVLEDSTYGFAQGLGALGMERDSLTQMLLVLPPFGLMVSALAIYFALRASGKGFMPALFGAGVFALSPLMLLSNSMGVYGWPQLSILLASLGLLALSLGGMAQLFGGPVLFLLAALSYSGGGLVAIATGLACLAEEFYSKGEKRKIAPYAAIVLAGVVGLGFSGFALPPMQDIVASLGEARFIFPLAAFTLAGAARKFSEKGDMFNFASLALAAGVAAFFPMGAMLVLAIPAGNGAAEMLRLHMKTIEEKLLAYFCAAFLLALLFSGFAGNPISASVMSAVFAAAVLVILYMYEFKGDVIPLCILVLLLVGAIVASSYAMSSATLRSKAIDARKFSFLDENTVAAFSWLGENSPAGSSVAYYGDSKGLEFISGRKALADQGTIAKFLATKSSPALLKSAGADYLVLESSVLDNPEGLANASGTGFNVESYWYFGNYSSGDYSFAILQSSRNEFLVRPLNDAGEFTLGDSDLLNSGMAAIARIRFSELMVLDSSVPYSDSGNRVVRPLDSYDANAVTLFAQNASGMREVYGGPGIRIFALQ